MDSVSGLPGGEVAGPLVFSNDLGGLAFSPDGKTLVVGGDHGVVFRDAAGGTFIEQDELTSGHAFTHSPFGPTALKY